MIIKHWGEDSNTNTEARQAAKTQKEITTVGERGSVVLLHVILLPRV